MRFEKGDDFVEIVDGLSVDHNGKEVWFVESSLELKDLPITFRNQVLKSDKEGFEKLKNNIADWAENNEYTSA